MIRALLVAHRACDLHGRSVIFVDYVGVCPAHRRRGVGSQMIVRCLTLADRVVLMCHRRNRAARRFYAAIGLRPCSDADEVYGVDSDSTQLYCDRARLDRRRAATTRTTLVATTKAWSSLSSSDIDACRRFVQANHKVSACVADEMLSVDAPPEYVVMLTSRHASA